MQIYRRMRMRREQKYCTVCGRQMTWRKRWQRNWEQVRYCSKACRRRGLSSTDRQLETAIMGVLDTQATSDGISIQALTAELKTIPADHQPQHLVPATKNAVRRLANSGSLEVRQHGRRVDPSTTKGPFTIRRPK